MRNERYSSGEQKFNAHLVDVLITELLFKNWNYLLKINRLETIHLVGIQLVYENDSRRRCFRQRSGCGGGVYGSPNREQPTPWLPTIKGNLRRNTAWEMGEERGGRRRDGEGLS